MHGLPLAWAKFERRNVEGVGWRVAVTGQNELVRGTYRENGNRSQITLAETGWYLVVVQTETARAATEIELETPTALAINTLGRWSVGEIVQPIAVTAAANGLTDPAVETLTRQWHPFERVSMAWVVETKDKDQPVRWRIDSGQTVGQHTLTIYAWRLFNYAGGIQKNESPNRVLFAPIAAADVSAVRLDPPLNPWYNPTLLDWYRVTASSTQATNTLRWNVETLADYTHKLQMFIRSTPGTTATGDPGFRVFDAQGTNIFETKLLYQTPNQSIYESDFARRAAGQRVAALEIFEIEQTDAFDVRAVLNVTD
jgi:hypothetical protein